MNGGEPLDAGQILRLVAESAPAARDRLVIERRAHVARLAEITKLLDALEGLHEIAAPMVPNAGTMEGEA